MRRTWAAVGSTSGVLVALAVVILASRGDASDRTAAAFETATVGRTLFLLILGTAFLISAGLAAWALWPDASGPRKPPPPARWLPYVALTALILLIAFFAPERRAERLGPEEPSATAPAAPQEERPDDTALAGRASPTASLTLVAVAVAALLGFTLLLRRRREAELAAETRDEDGAGDPAPDLLTEDLVAAIAAGDLAEAVRTVAAEPDPRRAVLLGYAVLDAHLAPTPAARPRTATPHEWLGAIRRVHGAAAPHAVDSARRLTALYERARFAVHPMTADDRDEVVAALRVLHARPLPAGAPAAAAGDRP